MFTVSLTMQDLDLVTPEDAVRAFVAALRNHEMQYKVTDAEGATTYVDFGPSESEAA